MTLKALTAALVLAAMALPAAAESAPEAREIAAAFEGHGMNSARAACFGETIATELPAEERGAAAMLVREAATPDDIQLGVIRAGGSMVGAFTMADVNCPAS